MVIVQWDNLFEFTDGPDVGPSVGKFQAIVSNSVSATDPEIQFEYGTPGALPAEATVGIENADGTAATAFVNAGDPAPAWAAGVVCFDYLAPEFPPATLSYSVTVDEPIAAGVITNQAAHITDNYGDATAIAAADVEIEAPMVAYDPLDTFFGELPIGDTSEARMVTVTNVGSADLEIMGASAADGFTVDASACVAASPLAPDASCELSATFTASLIGLVNSPIELDSNAVPATTPGRLLGVGVAPDLAVSPAEGAQFGDVIVGSTSELTLALVNSGNADLTISGVTAPDPFGVVSETCTAAALAPDAACQVVVSFAPAEIGEALAALTVESDADGAPHDVVLAGNGVVASPIMTIDPARYWDTRAGQPTFDGLYAGTGRLGNDAMFPVQIAGRGGVPAGAAGVVANLTVVLPGGPGYATVYPCTDARPVASLVNYLPGEIWANTAVVPLNDAGQVCVFTKATADYALDVNGYVTDGSAVVAMTPERFLDTRSTGRRVPSGGVLEVQVATVGGVPADAAAALLNVTAVNPSDNGFFTVYPCTDPRPTASSLNYLAGQNVPNGVIAELSARGSICIFSRASSDVLVDVSGYLPAATDGITAISPERMYDSRAGSTTVDGQQAGTPARLVDRQTVEIQVAGRGSVPADAAAVMINAASVTPSSAGYLTLFPCGDRPTASNLNWATAGGLRANNSITRLSDDGTVCVFARGATDVVLDVTGWLD